MRPSHLQLQQIPEKKHPWSGHPAAVMRESNVYLMSYILTLLEFCPPWSLCLTGGVGVALPRLNLHEQTGHR